MKHSICKFFRNPHHVLVVTMIVLSLSFQKVYGQDNKIESLKKLYKSASQDTTRCRLLLLIGGSYEDSNPDTAYVIFNKAYELAKNAKDNEEVFSEYIFRALFRLGYNANNYIGDFKKALQYANDIQNYYQYLVKTHKNKKFESIAKNGYSCYPRLLAEIYFRMGDLNKSVEQYKVGLKLCEEVGNIKAVTRCCMGIAYIYNKLGDSVQSMNYFNKELKFLEVLNDSAYWARYHLDIGDVYQSHGNYTKAIEHLQIAGNLYLKLNLPTGLNHCYTFLGNIYQSCGNYKKALENYNKLLQISEKSGDNYLIACANASLGGLYEKAWKTNEAKDYTESALNFFKEIKDSDNISRCYLVMGDFYVDRKDYTKALPYYFDALKIQEKIGFKDVIGSCLIYIGEVFQAKGNYLKAIDYYLKAIIIQKEINDKPNLCCTYYNLSDTYFTLYEKSKKYILATTALDYGLKAYQISKETGSISSINDIANHLQKMYSKLDNYNEAYKYAQIYISTSDSLKSKEKTKYMAEAEMKFDAKTKQLQIDKLTKEKELQRVTLMRNKILVLGSLIGFIIIMLFSIFLYQLFLQKKAANMLIAKKNEVLEMANEEILAQKEEIMCISENEKRLNQVKIEFFTNISHEFRTPLTLIKSPLEKLLSGETDPVRKEQYQFIHNNANKLNQMVDQILDFRRFDAGKFSLELCMGDIVGFVRTTLHSFTSHAEVRQLKLSFDAFADTYEMAFDPKLFAGSLMNILSNACKNTQPGGTVSCSVALISANQECQSGENFNIQVDISNTGKNIPEEQLDAIFEPFIQVPGTVYGTGLGLALTREMMHLHKGQVYATNLTNGVCFSLVLPIGLTETGFNFLSFDQLTDGSTFPSENTGSMTDMAPDYRKKLNKVLVVEDHLELNKFLYNELVTDYKVFCAYDGITGLQMAIDILPDLVISDIMMPELNGLELCERLKTDERTSHIPIILLTARASEANIVEGIGTGADDYLVKPFSLKELKARVTNTIIQRQRIRLKFMNNLISAEVKELVTNSTDANFLEKAIVLIEKSINQHEFGVSELAAGLGMSRSNLYEKIKKLTNESPSMFIQSIHLKKAAQLLASKQGNVSEIAYAVGFTDSNYFIRSFKKRFGITPGEYIMGMPEIFS